MSGWGNQAQRDKGANAPSFSDIPWLSQQYGSLIASSHVKTLLFRQRALLPQHKLHSNPKPVFIQVKKFTLLNPSYGNSSFEQTDFSSFLVSCDGEVCLPQNLCLAQAAAEWM